MKSILFILVSFIALTAILSGLVMISNPDGGILNLPLSLLYDTPFKDYKLPGTLLTVFVGGINLAALFLNLQRHPQRYSWSIAGGAVTSGWIIIQMILIGVFHWLHALYLVLGILIILIAYQLKGKWVV
jgi:hypothetical protein